MSESASPIEINDRAEGSLMPQEATRPAQTTTIPVMRLSDERHGPAAETGLIAMVVDEVEARENKDAQDASRTTAENRMVPETQTNAKEKRKPSSTPSILIIEDSTELAEIIEATLQRLDMVTAHETHGNRALLRYDEIKPDVVLLDIGLPDMTGWKLLEDIKERKGAAPMPAVVVITAYGDPANRLIGKLQNVHDYLIKPFTADEVEKVVISALSSTR
jgi:CheY-like chemotaxis protein